jgi:hypothetical protein
MPVRLGVVYKNVSKTGELIGAVLKINPEQLQQEKEYFSFS